MTLLFLVGQGFYLARHLHDTDSATSTTNLKD
jgi:hypothetical protein